MKNYDTLKAYFSSVQYRDDRVLAILEQPQTKLYLEFLKMFLQKTLAMIEAFQKDKITMIEA